MTARAFDPERFEVLRRRLELPWGLPLHYRRQTGSTNDDAVRAARDGEPEGSVFLAEYQSAGRGRLGKRWWSGTSAGLLFSVLLRPECDARSGPLFTLAAGLAVRAAVANWLPESVGQRVLLKWPNDVVVVAPDQTSAFPAFEKLSGVLCEGQLSGRSLQSLVVGIGINLVQDTGHETLPTAAYAIAPTSLAAQGASTSDLREPLLAAVLSELRTRTRASGRGINETAIVEEFRTFDALHRRPVRIALGDGRELCGTARGVDTQGQLLIDGPSGMLAVHSGTVRPEPVP